jgi:hypothetical protein
MMRTTHILGGYDYCTHILFACGAVLLGYVIIDKKFVYVGRRNCVVYRYGGDGGEREKYSGSKL